MNCGEHGNGSCTCPHPDERPTCADCRDVLVDGEADFCAACMEVEFPSEATRPIPAVSMEQLVSEKRRVA